MTIEATESGRLSRLLFEARELIDMFGDIVEARTGQIDTFSRRVRDEIDAYRAEQGWSPNGFGGEGDGWESRRDNPAGSDLPPPKF